MTVRGQTLHDYLLGVVIVILTIGAAVGVLGAQYEPFFDPVDAEDQTLADATSDRLIAVSEASYGERTVSISALDSELSDINDSAYREGTLGLEGWHQIQIVVVETATGEPVLERGDAREGGAEATSVRVVQTTGNECENTCRLIVRVWR